MRSERPALLPVLLLLLAGTLLTSATRAGAELRIGGYVQGAPVRISTPAAGNDSDWLEYRLQNRLNLLWSASPELSFHAGIRTRLFAGDPVRKVPHYAANLTRDGGLLDLSWTLVEHDNRLLHVIPDRLYVESDRNDWNVRLGRQRVNWGVNLITNPNDIFNIYSVYDFDYPERPGSDALRIQRFLGPDSRLELAASPARHLEQSVAAALYAFSLRGYDIQLIAGYYRERLAAGGGWAGNLSGAGFKGEAMFFSGGEKDNGNRDGSVVIATSIDYMFANGLFLVTELLYNQDGGDQDFQLLGNGLSADNPSVAEYQAAVQMSYLLHPLLNGSLTTIYFPRESALFVSPALTWSVIEDLDLTLLGQFFIGGANSVFDNAGHLITASLKYSF